MVEVDQQPFQMAIGLKRKDRGMRQDEIFFARYENIKGHYDDLSEDVLLANDVRLAYTIDGTIYALYFSLRGLDLNRLHVVRHGLAQ